MTTLLCTAFVFLACFGGVCAAFVTRERQELRRQRMAQVIGAETGSVLDQPQEPTEQLLQTTAGLLQKLVGKRGRRAQFAAQIPDALLLLAAALRSGYSPARAVQTVAEDMPAPLGVQLAAAAAEIQLGLPVVTALNHVGERASSLDWDLAVTAVATQAQTGGNLAEILERISETIRERVRMQGEIDSLTAEGRLSAALLAGLPPLLAVLLSLRSPHYFQPLLTCPLGHVMIAGAVAGQVIGMLILRRLLTLDI